MRLEKFLHVILSKKGLEIVKKLEALLIRNFCEGIIWLIAIEYWIETSIAIIEAHFYHILIH